MKWELDKNRPICPQICEQLCARIAVGEFKPNDRLLSVRAVAVEAGVNPGTVQKAFEQLEAEGLIYSMVGSGWYVGESIDAAKETVGKMVKQKTGSYFESMRRLGMTNDETKKYAAEFDADNFEKQNSDKKFQKGSDII